ncbi:hypothetical protein A2159_03390 [Candidatus Woesebacteria bacterium RBG_13_34_9]|uniref:Uncharacterized protein n=1 Tax=Candidatus Woesebacteria bacterium RBG_13_34_9 TaxID=1802477 RepID=A0A1F7X1H7_9BACT|nr:MAG: hypothetical protein A2159_03390 [Candidatus Woesebacteria bacterium RBG_13_34_9]
MSKKEGLLEQLINRFNESRVSLLKNPGELCPSCSTVLELKEIGREYLGRWETYGSGYAGASTFKSGEPDQYRFEIRLQVACPQCNFRGRISTQIESKPVE